MNELHFVDLNNGRMLQTGIAVLVVVLNPRIQFPNLFLQFQFSPCTIMQCVVFGVKYRQYQLQETIELKTQTGSVYQ